MSQQEGEPPESPSPPAPASSVPARLASISTITLSPFQEHKHEYTAQQHAEYLQRQAFIQGQSPAVMFPIISESISQRPLLVTNVVAAPVLSIVIFIIAYFSDHYGNDRSVANFFRIFVESDPDKMRGAIGSSLRALANIFSLVITFSGVVLQLASNRYSAQAIRLLFEDWWALSAIGVLLLTLILETLVLYSLGDMYIGHVVYVICMFLTIVCLMVVFPYFYYLFDWLDPVKIVKRIEHHVHEATDARALRIEGIQKNQIKTIRGIDHLADIAKTEADKNGRNIAFSVLDSLLSYCLYYQEKKVRKHPNWFFIPASIKSTPDFEFLPEEVLGYYEQHKIWIEAKILRQFHSIFVDNLRVGRTDMCFLAVASTRRVAEAALKRKDEALLVLCITFFNTYLRAGIKSKIVRVAYHTMHLYRQLAESLLAHIYYARESKKKDENNIDEAITNLLIDIHNMHWVYYYNLALGTGEESIAETIAHDQATLVEAAFFLGIKLHDQLLEGLLSPRWCENSNMVQNVPTPLGVLRAQIKLATSYICGGKVRYAKQIFTHLFETPLNKLEVIWKDFVSIKSPSFWEINDRGYHLDYLNVEQKAALKKFMSWFEGFVIPPVPGDERGVHQPLMLWSPSLTRLV